MPQSGKDVFSCLIPSLFAARQAHGKHRAAALTGADLDAAAAAARRVGGDGKAKACTAAARERILSTR